MAAPALHPPPPPLQPRAQVERVIGAEDVARFRSELEQGAPQAAAAAAVAGQQPSSWQGDDEEEDDGFFAADEVAALEQQPAQAAAPPPPAAAAKKAKKQRSGTLRTTDVLGKPGPFDAWFGGDGGKGASKAYVRRVPTPGGAPQGGAAATEKAPSAQ